jgi:hypothetical protein
LFISVFRAICISCRTPLVIHHRCIGASVKQGFGYCRIIQLNAQHKGVRPCSSIDNTSAPFLVRILSHRYPHFTRYSTWRAVFLPFRSTATGRLRGQVVLPQLNMASLSSPKRAVRSAWSWSNTEAPCRSRRETISPWPYREAPTNGVR